MRVYYKCDYDDEYVSLSEFSDTHSEEERAEDSQLSGIVYGYHCDDL